MTRLAIVAFLCVLLCAFPTRAGAMYAGLGTSIQKLVYLNIVVQRNYLGQTVYLHIVPKFPPQKTAI